jgi:diphthamide biosynthesis enzyme Dph1/Dph2-like protein
MSKFEIEDLNKKYNLELDKIIQTIKEKKPKNILLQLPDGLKPWGTTLVDYIEEQTEHKNVRIHLGSCFGACDLPTTKANLIIQFGHAKWSKKEFNEMD